MLFIVKDIVGIPYRITFLVTEESYSGGNYSPAQSGEYLEVRLYIHVFIAYSMRMLDLQTKNGSLVSLLKIYLEQ